MYNLAYIYIYDIWETPFSRETYTDDNFYVIKFQYNTSSWG